MVGNYCLEIMLRMFIITDCLSDIFDCKYLSCIQFKLYYKSSKEISIKALI